MIKVTIKQTIQKALTKLSLPEVDFVIEHPTDLFHGDYSTNVAMVVAKGAKQNPKELAEEIARYIKHLKVPEIEKVEVAGPGFINFYLSQSFFKQSISNILEQGGNWGSNKNLQDKLVMVEYTDPNPFKEMHIGHLMSNTIGESISRLIAYSGANVIRANYQGDVGLHVAKALYGMKHLQRKTKEQTFSAARIGEAYTNGALAYESSEKTKKIIDDINKKVYNKSDAALNELYEKGRQISLEAFEAVYKKLGTVFNEYYFESKTGDIGRKIVEEHLEVFEESDDATVFRGEKYGLHTRVFLTSRGLPTYEAKDLGLAWLKFQDYPDLLLSITITAGEQREYFKVMRAAFRVIYPDFDKKLVHITHGFMKLPTGKMSSRTGDVVAALDLIEEVQKKVKDKMKGRDVPNRDTTALDVAVSALKYSILKQASGKDIVFDFEKSVSFEGDSGPYLQYAHTRAQSVLQKAASGGIKINVDSRSRDTFSLERLLYRFSSVVERASIEYEPHYVTTYLVELASSFNGFYANERIVDATDNPGYKLALTNAFQITMQNGLWLLGIKTPERM